MLSRKYIQIIYPAINNPVKIPKIIKRALEIGNNNILFNFLSLIFAFLNWLFNLFLLSIWAKLSNIINVE